MNFETKIPYKAIKKNINKIDSSIKEAVANAIDAKATEIRIDIYEDEFTGAGNLKIDGIKFVKIRDNGEGINIEKFEDIFCHYRVSNKKNDKSKYGKRGVGRFIYLKLTNFNCNNIELFTKWKGKTYQIHYHCIENEPIKFLVKEVDKDLQNFSTLLLFKNIQIEGLNTVSEISEYIKDEIVIYFADIIPYKKIYVNGELLKIENYLLKKLEETITIDEHKFNIIYYFWSDKVKLNSDRQKHIQFLDEFNHLKGIKASGKDKLSFYSKKFPHTITIKSAFFNELETEDMFFEADEILSKLLRQVKVNLEKNIIKIYKENIKEVTKEYIKYLKENIETELEENVYSTILLPLAEKLTNHRVKEDIKKLIVNLIKVLINEEPSIFIKNLNLILGYNKKHQELIHYVESNYGVLKTLIEKDNLLTRLDILKNFENMVYGKEKKHIKERTQLHLVVENNLWILGEKFEHFNMGNFYSDISIKRIIEKHLKAKIYDDSSLQQIKNINKIPDIVIPLREENTLYIIELKKPSVKINDKIIFEVKNKYIKTLQDIMRHTSIQYKLYGIAVSDDKTEDVTSLGNIDEYGYVIKPKTWQEIIQNTKKRYEERILILQSELKKSKWKDLQDFITYFSKNS